MEAFFFHLLVQRFATKCEIISNNLQHYTLSTTKEQTVHSEEEIEHFWQVNDSQF